MEYKDTLNLPVTDFPMRASLPQREPEILARWAELELDRRVSEPQDGKPNFTLHDGPPYANGHIHIGHALNKILKDIVVKSRRMQGFYAPFVPGWDCHGLPIELKVDQQLGEKKRAMSKVEIRRECRAYAQQWIDIQRAEFKRLGVLGDWQHPYLTMNHAYEAATARELARFAERGGLYKGKKPVHWCSSCVTALAEAEVEYGDHTSPSIYVKFPYADTLPAGLEALAGKPLSFVIWTTTPWTIPANLAVALNPELPYVAVESDGELLVMAEGLMARVFAELGRPAGTVVATIEATAFEGKQCRHPLYDRPSLIVLGDYVTLEAGTGCVHTAPGHGHDDYQTGLRYGLEIYNPVDDYGRYLPSLELFGGQKVPAVNPQVTAKLLEVGALLNEGKVSHSYPHCWRCKKPIIFRATEQWFIAMETNDLRGQALKHIDATHWIPAWGRERIYNMVANRPDWCISRQRSWGVPITAFYCTRCGEALADGKVMHHVADLFETGGSDVWFEKEAARAAPCRRCLHQLRRRGIPQGDGHPRCLVRLRRLPRRRGRATAAALLPGRSLPGGERPAPRLVPLEPAGGRRHPRHLTVQGGADPRLRPRPGGPADVEVGRQRGRPGGGHQEVRRRDPAPVGGYPGLPQRHALRRQHPPAGLRGLPAHPQHRPLHPRQYPRFRRRPPTRLHTPNCSPSTAGP